MRRIGLFLIIVLSIPVASWSEPPHFATGVKVGEVSDTSAIVWVRLTRNEARRADGLVQKGRFKKGEDYVGLASDVRVEDLEGSALGMAGEVRLSYHPVEPQKTSSWIHRETAWVQVSDASGFAHAFRTTDLRPGTRYLFEVTARSTGSAEPANTFAGSFRTAPAPDQEAPVTFTVITGQAYRDHDVPEGFKIYPSMERLKPHFIIPTGDTIYYDSDIPLASDTALARYHWDRMYSFPTLIDFHKHVPGYWIKDDHDTLSNDCWPTMNPKFMLPLTFEEGQRLFREQVPMSEKTFRTFRWGKHLQVWITEGRDFRSPNDMEDGPEKTIWGEEQLRWLAETIRESDATWKILASATPIVGPDRTHKADNHANSAFDYEGNRVRNWIAENSPDNLFVVCGDRHWQYHSVDPKTGVQEFSCGPASDQHAGGFPDGAEKVYTFSRVLGGFLSVSVEPKGDAESRIVFRHHDVDGEIVYEYTESRS